jgi:hypothetical protein
MKFPCPRVYPFVFLLMLCLHGCGYRFGASSSGLSADVRTVAIPVFVNQTIQTGIESEVTRALVEKFIAAKRISVGGQSAADALVEGRVKAFATSPVTITAGTHTATEYRATLTLGISLKRLKDGKILWKEGEISEWRNYRVEGDLARTEVNKKEAIRQISVLLAERVHDWILEDF